MRLNLLCSRLDEVSPALQVFLHDLQSALAAGKDSMNSFLQAFLPSLDAATVAHSANAEAQQAQASRRPLTQSSCHTAGRACMTHLQALSSSPYSHIFETLPSQNFEQPQAPRKPHMITF